MKFAVIEYSSKSGAIWRHTSARPNYLCDPVSEIDPTSFGCYVSALAGEHIPLTALINPNVLSRVIKRLTRSWPQGYSLEYLASFDVLMIVHQISDGHEITAFTRRLRRTFPKMFIMGVPTQPFGLLQKYWENHPDWLKDFREFMSLCNVFVSVVRETVPVWQGFSSRPVAYVPQPYPAHFAMQHYLPRANKKPRIFVSGVTSRPEITRGMIVAKLLQQQFPRFTVQVTSMPGDSLDTTELTGSRFEVLPFESWHEHLRSLREMMLVINTDYTLTRGRVQADCAAVGTPSLGANSDGQRDLFPDFYASPATSLEELVAMGQRLLQDATYYERVVQQARDRLPYYDYPESAERIRELVGKYNYVQM